MRYILAERGGQFFLAAFAEHLRGCNLSTPEKPRLDADKYHLWQDRIWVWSHAWPGDIVFFPEIRYRGCKVYPWGWQETAHEPMLQIFSDDIDASKYFKANPQVNTSDLRRALIADGWDWDAREGGLKYVHVDELEKIEGPPPEGPF
jgi:hypothetical protein